MLSRKDSVRQEIYCRLASGSSIYGIRGYACFDYSRQGYRQLTLFIFSRKKVYIGVLILKVILNYS